MCYCSNNWYEEYEYECNKNEKAAEELRKILNTICDDTIYLAPDGKYRYLREDLENIVDNLVND